VLAVAAAEVAFGLVLLAAEDDAADEESGGSDIFILEIVDMCGKFLLTFLAAC